MPSPPMHYLWVGPKPLDTNSGQDTVGPDILRQKYSTDDQPITFWCLDSEVDNYKAHFSKEHKERADIQVKGIESYAVSLPSIPYKRVVKKPNPDQSNDADDFIIEETDIDLKTEFISLVDTLKIRAERFEGDKTSQIQEWITIKDAFAYFIQIFEEGYIADSNVTPTPFDELADTPIERLNDLKEFYCAFIPDDRSKQGIRPDPWLMFCKKEDPKAFARFDSYVREVMQLLKQCVDSAHNPVPQDTNTMLDPTRIERPIRGMISSVFVATAHKDASYIEAKPSVSHAKHNDTSETSAQMIKRYSNSHYRSEKTPLIERLLVGISSPQEFYHFAKRQAFDPFKAFECQSVNIQSLQIKAPLIALDEKIDELKQDIYELEMDKRDPDMPFSDEDELTLEALNTTLDDTMDAYDEETKRLKDELTTLFPQPTSMVKIAILLNKYHDLGTMMALSKDPLVVQALLEAPKDSGCLEIYFKRQCDSVGEQLTIPKDQTEKVLCQQLIRVLSLTDKIYPARAPRDTPETMQGLIGLLKQETNTSAHKMLELIATLGPIKDEASIDAYMETLKTWHSEEKIPPSPTHFRTPQIGPFEEGETRETLKQLLEATPSHRFS